MNGINMQNKEFLQNKKIINIINDYKAGMSVKNLCIKYQYKTRNSIYNIIHTYENITNSNIIRHSNKLETIVSPIKILLPYEVNKYLLTINHLNTHIYNAYDFSLLDCAWKAYFIGIMLTDGCINCRNQIDLRMTDSEAVILFANNFNIKYKIRSYNNCNSSNKLIKHKKNIYYFTLGNQLLVSQLRRFGIVYHKTYNLYPPILYPEEYQFLPYIFQGIIDGDGCILHNGKLFYIVSTSKEFLAWCKNILENWFNMQSLNLHNIQGKKYSMPFYQLSTSIITNMQILKNEIYYNNIGILRKGNILYDKLN